MSNVQDIQRSYWDQVRYHLAIYASISHTPKHTAIFKPGDIAACHGSIEIIFYQLLAQLGFELRHDQGERETMRPSRQGPAVAPLRYCVINRHIQGQLYEVFLLTTFGGARNLRTLDSVGQYFAMPMGSTQWIQDVQSIPGIWTSPPIFGQNSPSFLFALPTIQTVPRTKVKARVPPSELQRVIKYAEAKLQTLPRDHWRLRRSLRDRRWSSSEWSGDDTFAPTREEEIQSADDYMDDGPFIKPYRSGLSLATFQKTFRFSTLPPNDITWLFKHSQNDITNTSRYLNQMRTIRPQCLTLPKPYYAACLRVNPSKIRQFLR